MSHGGKRKGAGRPKGIQAGTKAERLAAELGKGQTTPLKYMLNMLNNPQVSIEKKMWAAKEAAPFVHSKLQSVNKTIMGDEDKPVAVTIGWRKKK
jgi:hypothetical protein|tara:strand:+ start:301 stop:585 length:285 start_codon:yes stop_codon:yes gene_type:complete